MRCFQEANVPSLDIILNAWVTVLSSLLAGRYIFAYYNDEVFVGQCKIAILRIGMFLYILQF